MSKKNSSGNRLSDLIPQIEKRYGENIVRKGNALPNCTYLPTGIFLIDLALLGGIPESKMSLVYGWQSSGKSTLAMKVAASAQRKYPDSSVLYIDSEGSYDPLWAEKNGVDNERVVYVDPQSGEQAVDIMNSAIVADDLSLIILDSIAGTVPLKEVESSAEDAIVAVRARLMSRFLTSLKLRMSDELRRGHKVTAVTINQFRTNIGVMFGDNRVLPGGATQRYTADVMLEMKNAKPQQGKSENDVAIFEHNEHAFEIKKCKTGNSLPSGQFTMIRSPQHVLGVSGIDDGDTVVAYGKKMGMVTSGGGNWKFDGCDESFGSKDELVAHFYNEPEEYRLFKTKLIAIHRTSMGLPALPPDEYL